MGVNGAEAQFAIHSKFELLLLLLTALFGKRAFFRP